MLAQTPSATVDLCNVNNLAAFANFEGHCPLTKLLADTDHQLAGRLELSWLNDHFQPITCLLVYFTVVGNPGTLKWSFQRVATKGVTHLSQDVPTRCGADLCTVISMRRNPCNHKQRDILLRCDMQHQSMLNIVSYVVLFNKWYCPYHGQYRGKTNRGIGGRRVLSPFAAPVPCTEPPPQAILA